MSEMKICRRCGKPRLFMNQGRCFDCQKFILRAKRCRSQPCRHCGQLRFLHCRKLCRPCYNTPSIRDLYPPQQRGKAFHEPTMAELEAMIAEQRQHLPSWWDRETRLLQEGADV